MPEPEPELMTYGELAEAYRRALAEIDKLRAALTASDEDAQHTPTEETP